MTRAANPPRGPPPRVAPFQARYYFACGSQLVSLGPLRISVNERREMKILGILLLGFVLGFASATAIQSLLDAGTRSKSKRTAADCRIISTALESYRMAEGQYPPLDGNVEHLARHLVPRYIKQLPTRDMDNQPYLVVLNGTRATVISTGKYGVAVEAGTVIRKPFPEISEPAPN